MDSFVIAATLFIVDLVVQWLQGQLIQQFYGDGFLSDCSCSSDMNEGSFSFCSNVNLLRVKYSVKLL